ncbi:ATP-binding protein [Methanobacterium formicicum]|uniref:Putative DNA binding domain-containing protein n=1 Tax=Methanobacterium formicicum TaxID=2162 RepID=A0A843AZ69_METFO|nr:ATP-binding protein [Methanobacterium formicicum]MBF4475925.1 putative DNA binding domain-containing protein [Methanobacterium formicicum]
MFYEESEHIELKKSINRLPDALKSICAFCNHRGGSVFFGVTSSGEIKGVDVSDKVLLKISQQINRIRPEITPEIREINEDGKSLIEVKVLEGNNKPYFLNGIAYIRVGTEDKLIPPDELKRIIIEENRENWDEEIKTTANFDEIDKDTLDEFLIRARESRNFDIDVKVTVEDALERLALSKNGLLTNAAVLLFTRDPQKFFPQAQVRCAKFKGNDITQPFIDMAVIDGNIWEQIAETEKFILSNIKRAAWFETEKMERTEHFEYPFEAIREAIINAICHRDYRSSGNVQIRIFDNSMEIWNPGKLPEGMTIGLLKGNHTSKPRNKLIAQSLFLTKYIEQWGSGTNKMIEACVNEGLPEPDFNEVGDDFRVILTRSRVNEILENPDLINNRQWKAIDYLKSNDIITSIEYAELFNCSHRTARMDLKGLVDLGIFEKKGKGNQIHYILIRSYRQLPAIAGNGDGN